MAVQWRVEELNPGDRERMLAFLRFYGDLSGALEERLRWAGLVVRPAGPDDEELQRLLADARVAGRKLLNATSSLEEGLDYQATMFQPAGGMDRIPYAFRAQTRQGGAVSLASEGNFARQQLA